MPQFSLSDFYYRDRTGTFVSLSQHSSFDPKDCDWWCGVEIFVWPKKRNDYGTESAFNDY